MTSPIRILLADDHPMLRESLGLALDAEPDFELVATVGEAGAALEAIRTLSPQIVLMDIEMPGLDPFGAAATLRREQPETSLIFLSGHSSDAYIQRSMEVGARGYVTKGEPPIVLYEAIREVARGGTYCSPAVRDRLREEGGARPATRGSSLSQREKEVLRYVARGMTKKEMALKMDVSVKTVEGHTENMMRKLRIHNKVDLARYAYREGMAQP